MSKNKGSKNVKTSAVDRGNAKILALVDRTNVPESAPLIPRRSPEKLAAAIAKRERRAAR